MLFALPRPRLLAAVLAAAACGNGLAAPDDFRVLSDDMPDAGETEMELQWASLRPPRRDADHAPVLQSLLEVSYGITPLWEVSVQWPGLRRDGAWYLTGVNLETQFVSSRHEPGFYWGARIELARSAEPGEPLTWGSEWRPILGWRAGLWHVVANPGIEVPLTGPERQAHFVPYAKVARQIDDDTHLGVEYFAQAGPLRRLWTASQRSEWLLAVIDTELASTEVHFGLGRGLTSGSDRWVMKMRVAY